MPDPTSHHIGAGNNPFYDLGALERRIVTPPEVIGVTADFANASQPSGLSNQNFYHPTSATDTTTISATNQTPVDLQFKLNVRLDPSTINNGSIILQASGGDGIFGNGNNSNDRTIDLSGKLSYNPSTQIVTVNLSGIKPPLTNDEFRITIFGAGANVVRDPQGNALDGKNTVGGSATGAQLPLPSGTGAPGSNFYFSFTISNHAPSLAPNTKVVLDPNNPAPGGSDTGRKGDSITALNQPAFSGTITDIFPPANAIQGQTVILDVANPATGLFGRLLPNGQPDPTDPNNIFSNVGSAITGAGGVFSVRVGTDGANLNANPSNTLGQIKVGTKLPDTAVNVGPDGYLGPNPITGAPPSRSSSTATSGPACGSSTRRATPRRASWRAAPT